MTDTVEINFDEVISKEPTALTDPEKTYLTDHKEELTTDERIKFGISGVENPKPEVRAGVPEIKPPTKKEGEEEDEIDPEDEKNISKVVGRYTEPLMKQSRELSQQTEINGFLQTNPTYSKYQESIKAQMDAHPTLTVRDAARIASADDMMKIGARREREARIKAESTRGGGSSVRNNNAQAKDWGSASKEEFEAKKAEILGHR